MRAIVRKVSCSFEDALAKFFGSGPTDLSEALAQHDAYVSKLIDFVSDRFPIKVFVKI